MERFRVCILLILQLIFLDFYDPYRQFTLSPVFVSADNGFTFDFFWECSMVNTTYRDVNNNTFTLTTSRTLIVTLTTTIDQSMTQIAPNRIVDHQTNPTFLPVHIHEDNFSYPLQLFQKISHFLGQDKYLGMLLSYRLFQMKVYEEAKSMCGMTNLYPEFRQYPYYISVKGLQRLTEINQIDQGYRGYRHLRYHSVNLLSLLYKQFSLALIITTSDNSCHNDYNNCYLRFDHPYMKGYLQNLKKEVSQLSLISHVVVLYGHRLHLKDWELFQIECQKLVDFFSNLASVNCHAINIPSDIMNDHQDILKDSRFYLSQQVYQYYQDLDYYLFLEFSLSLKLLKPSWLLSMIYPMLVLHRDDVTKDEPSLLSLDLGIAYSFNLRGPVNPLGKNYYLPNFFTLRSTHFQFIHDYKEILTKQFVGRDVDSFSFSMDSIWRFELPYHSEEYNNLLLVDAYRTVNSFTKNNIDYINELSDIFHYNDMEDFYDQLYLNRRILLTILMSKYSLSEYFYFKRMIQMKSEDDILFALYCQLSSGCLSDADVSIRDTEKIAKLNSLNEKTSENHEEIFHIDQLGMRNLHEIILGSKVRLDPMKVPDSLNQQTYTRKFPSSHPSSTNFWKHDYKPPLKRYVAVITAVYGNYEATLKTYVQQTIATDFYCFTENKEMRNNGWIIDTFPYHLLTLYHEFHENQLHYRNSYHHNLHPFNIAKFYKMQFYRIPILQEYDYIIWIDGTIAITNPKLVYYAIKIMLVPSPLNSSSQTFSNNFFHQRALVAFEHTLPGNLSYELGEALRLRRYLNAVYNGHHQPSQPLQEQLNSYLQSGYRLDYWREILRLVYQNDTVSPNLPSFEISEDLEYYGLWCTCFLAFNMRKELQSSDDLPMSLRSNNNATTFTIREFLDFWFHQNQEYTTEDQISFVYSAFYWFIFPYSLPSIQMKREKGILVSEGTKKDEVNIYGNYEFNNLFIKMEHGR